ncbi:hypothetical protein EVG20_g3159 [Dentipellis fragilis]|uniref:Uncharacterized protein n=1 Tax=Dentipellis fragilis TaxID=205917 RepID=A0A4Y9Z6L9_9AGAM|nr:hypothetical protein EVG20_g3159 [Dentipellis fragilis]
MTTSTITGKRKLAKVDHEGAVDKNGSKYGHPTAPTKRRKVTHVTCQQEPALPYLNTQRGEKTVKKRKSCNEPQEANVESDLPPPKKRRRTATSSALWAYKSTQALDYMVSRLDVSRDVPFSKDLHDHLLQSVWYNADAPPILPAKTAKRPSGQPIEENSVYPFTKAASANLLERTRAMAILDGMKPSWTSVEYTVIASHVLIVTRID